VLLLPSIESGKNVNLRSTGREMKTYFTAIALLLFPQCPFRLMIRLALFPAAILLVATAIPGGDILAQAKAAPNQIEEYQQRASRWDDGTAQRFLHQRSAIHER